MADDQKHTYDESKVKTLSSIEHIRLRPVATGRRTPAWRSLSSLPSRTNQKIQAGQS